MDSSADRLMRAAKMGALLFLLGGAGLFLSVKGYGIPCIFHLVTGLECPGCGITRMMLALVGGNLFAAWRYNPMLLTLSPFLLILILRLCLRYVRRGDGRLTRVENGVVWMMILCLMIFGVIRNTAFYPY